MSASRWAAALCLLALGLGFQAQPVVGAPASKFLVAGEIDPAVLLPPPPAAGSERALAEIGELSRLAATRTPERLAQAEHDADVEDVTAIATVIGPALDLERYPATKLLFADLRAEDSLVAKAAKSYFRRPRPWQADSGLAANPALDACDKGEPETSYPSGHATMGYSAAEVLALLMPGNSQIILARATDYAESRLVCGVHYRSDVEASHVLATALVTRLMTKPQFQGEFAAAQAELTAAHLAP
jgi:acid phosphatase (class A)